MRRLWAIWSAITLFTPCPALASDQLQPVETWLAGTPGKSGDLDTIIVDLQSGVGWSCVFTWNSNGVVYKMPTAVCYRLSSTLPAGNYLAQDYKLTSTIFLPAFILVDQITRTATGCVIPGWGANPSDTVCNTAQLN
jgi:hypothetical protein